MVDHDITRRVANYIESEVASASLDGELSPDFPIIENGIVDSLGLFKLVAFVEDEFRVSIDPEEIVFENFATVAAISNLIRNKVAKGGDAEVGVRGK